MATAMNATSILRIFIRLQAAPQSCEWALLDGRGETLLGNGLLTRLPRDCTQVELVLAAADVLFTGLKLPGSARRHSAAVLGFAVEEVTAGDPENSEVSLLGTDADGRSVLAVVDKSALLQWRNALAAAGVGEFTLSCETLLLPWEPGCWSLGWDGSEGFVRTAWSEGSVTDSTANNTPPLSLQLQVEAARTEGEVPTRINLYMTSAEAAPDVQAWSLALGVQVQAAGRWQWHEAVTGAGPALAQPRQQWQLFAGMTERLRPACWILIVALAVHALVTISQWSALASEQEDLRAQMESRFRAVFPEAVAVVDPVLQMRRQLATARQAAGILDSSDFLPLLERLARATAEVPAGSLLLLVYENDRLTLEYSGATRFDIPRLQEDLRQSGLVAEFAPVATGSNRQVLMVSSL